MLGIEMCIRDRSYVQQQKGDVRMLAAGVLCAVIAVILDGKAYGEVSKGKEVSRKSIITCVVSGVLMGLWAPFSTRALTHGNTLGPYSIAVFLTGGALLSCFVWNVYFMKKPLVGEPDVYKRQAPQKQTRAYPRYFGCRWR